MLVLKSEMGFHEFENNPNGTSEVEKNDIAPGFALSTEGW